jgi:hypothetical protein
MGRRIRYNRRTVKDESVRMWEEVIVAYVSIYIDVFLKGLSETTNQSVRVARPRSEF